MSKAVLDGVVIEKNLFNFHTRNMLCERGGSSAALSVTPIHL